jgi:ADP-heptose:LPS heptosyltransferase
MADGGSRFRLPRLPFGRGALPPVPPRKALILQPCCLGRVMLTTPLLAALSEAFPDARFDWAVSDWARQAVSSNPRVTRLILTGAGDIATATRDELRTLLDDIRAEAYDTCFIPSASGEVLARLAREAGVAQRIGLSRDGRRRDLTHAIAPPPGERGQARAALALAAAVGAPAGVVAAAEMEFHPPDRDRTAAARWLVEDLDWLGDRPLVIMQPGGGQNPAGANLDKRWPAERFARLGNYLIRAHGARVALVGLAEERSLAAQVAGMMSLSAAERAVANRAGQIGLGELAALCELAGLYVGNDVGSTYVAAATGCPTLAIYGPTDPAVTAPYMVNGRVTTLWRPYDGVFSWATGVTVEEAAAAAATLLQTSEAFRDLRGLT